MVTREFVPVMIFCSGENCGVSSSPVKSEQWRLRRKDQSTRGSVDGGLQHVGVFECMRVEKDVLKFGHVL